MARNRLRNQPASCGCCGNCILATDKFEDGELAPEWDFFPTDHDETPIVEETGGVLSFAGGQKRAFWNRNPINEGLDGFSVTVDLKINSLFSGLTGSAGIVVGSGNSANNYYALIRKKNNEECFRLVLVEGSDDLAEIVITPKFELDEWITLKLCFQRESCDYGYSYGYNNYKLIAYVKDKDEPASGANWVEAPATRAKANGKPGLTVIAGEWDMDNFLLEEVNCTDCPRCTRSGKRCIIFSDDLSPPDGNCFWETGEGSWDETGPLISEANGSTYHCKIPAPDEALENGIAVRINFTVEPGRSVGILFGCDVGGGSCNRVVFEFFQGGTGCSLTFYAGAGSSTKTIAFDEPSEDPLSAALCVSLSGAALMAVVSTGPPPGTPLISINSYATLPFGAYAGIIADETVEVYGFLYGEIRPGSSEYGCQPCSQAPGGYTAPCDNCSGNSTPAFFLVSLPSENITGDSFCDGETPTPCSSLEKTWLLERDEARDFTHEGKLWCYWSVIKPPNDPFEQCTSLNGGVTGEGEQLPPIERGIFWAPCVYEEFGIDHVPTGGLDIGNWFEAQDFCAGAALYPTVCGNSPEYECPFTGACACELPSFGRVSPFAALLCETNCSAGCLTNDPDPGDAIFSQSNSYFVVESLIATTETVTPDEGEPYTSWAVRITAAVWDIVQIMGTVQDTPGHLVCVVTDLAFIRSRHIHFEHGGTGDISGGCEQVMGEALPAGPIFPPCGVTGLIYNPVGS